MQHPHKHHELPQKKPDRKTGSSHLYRFFLVVCRDISFNESERGNVDTYC